MMIRLTLGSDLFACDVSGCNLISDDDGRPQRRVRQILMDRRARDLPAVTPRRRRCLMRRDVVAAATVSLTAASHCNQHAAHSAWQRCVRV